MTSQVRTCLHFMASLRLCCCLTAIWFKSEFDSDTLVLYVSFRHHFRVRGVGLLSLCASFGNPENVPWAGSNGHMCCRAFKSERTSRAFVPPSDPWRWAVRLNTSRQRAGVRISASEWEGSVFGSSWSVTKNVQHGLPPAVTFHTQAPYLRPPSPPQPTDFCHHVCPCVEMLRCVSPTLFFFNTKLHVCAVEVSALHQHVFIFHGQYNGVHGWESAQTCVGKHTLVAANPLLFLYPGIYVD